MAILTLAITQYEHHELNLSDCGKTLGDVINDMIDLSTNVSKITLSFDETEVPQKFIHTGTKLAQNDSVTSGGKRGK